MVIQRECPKCKKMAQEVAEEVDIGVGNQVFDRRIECSNCGQIAICNGCGIVETDGAKHHPWCNTDVG